MQLDESFDGNYRKPNQHPPQTTEQEDRCCTSDWKWGNKSLDVGGYVSGCGIRPTTSGSPELCRSLFLFHLTVLLIKFRYGVSVDRTS